MIKKQFEIFLKGEGTWGLVLKPPGRRKFTGLNHVLKAYPDGSKPGPDDECLFWVPQGRVDQVASILGLPKWPSASLYRDGEGT